MTQQLHLELILEIFLITFLIVLTIMGFLLYRRYIRSVYIIFASAIGVASLLNVWLFIEWLNKSEKMGLWLSSLSFASFCIVQLGFYHFFNQNKLKQLLVYIVPIVFILLTAAVLFEKTEKAILIIVTLNIVFTVFIYAWTKSHLPKIKMFQLSFILNLLAAITQAFFLIDYMNKYILFSASLGVMLIHYFIMFVIFFDRIIDLLQAVSTSSVQDGLTGLYNKTFFKKKVAEAVETQLPCSLIFSDIDNFKVLNDTLGHQMGDTMLKLVAQIMKEVCWEQGIVGRYGGEEMVALITNPKADIAEIAEIFRYRVENESLNITPITCSVGYSTLEKGTNAENLIIQADEAMYKAKKSGKNRVVSYQLLENEIGLDESVSQ